MLVSSLKEEIKKARTVYMLVTIDDSDFEIAVDKQDLITTLNEEFQNNEDIDMTSRVLNGNLHISN